KEAVAVRMRAGVHHFSGIMQQVIDVFGKEMFGRIGRVRVVYFIRPAMTVIAVIVIDRSSKGGPVLTVLITAIAVIIIRDIVFISESLAVEPDPVYQQGSFTIS